MIDEARTLEIFGYTSDQWAPRSCKKVVAVCEDCGKYRVVDKKQYRDFCPSCGRSGERHWCFGKSRSEDVKENISITRTGIPVSEETGRKISKALKGKRVGILHPMYGLVGALSPNFGRKASCQTKKKISIFRTGTTLSPETRRKISAAITGEKNPNRKGGVSAWRSLLMSSALYKNWRKAVYHRDGYTCQICADSTSGNLQAHHILPVRDHKNDLLIFDIDNGITLCKECHDTTKGHEYDFIDQFSAIVGGTAK